MVDEEDFGYTLPVKEATSADLLKTFRDDIGSYKKYAVLNLLEIGVIHYLREGFYGGLPRDGVYYSATILAEFYMVGSFLYSLYSWHTTPKQISELELMIDAKKK